jgi:hypothetical protein
MPCNRAYSRRAPARAAAVLALAIVAALLAGGAAGDGRAAEPGGSVVRELPVGPLLAAVNGVRRLRGLGPLSVSADLARAAAARARAMAEGGYFAHTAPDGVPFWKSIARFYPLRGFSRWRVGENLWWSAGEPPAAPVVRAWLASRQHAAVLLDRGWTDVGAAAIEAANVRALASGRTVTIVVADFGLRVR